MTRYEARVPFFLLWRQLRRGNVWTILLIVFLMAVAFINLIFVTSLFQGIIDGTNKQIVDAATGNIVVTPNTADGFFANPSLVLTQIKQESRVVGISPRTEFPARLSYDDSQRSWSVIAIDPQEESKVTSIHSSMIAGSYLNPGDTSGIILGRQIVGGKEVEMNALALKGIGVGDTVEVNLYGQKKSFTVRGIFSTKFLDTDQLAFISHAALNTQFPHYVNKVTNILIRLDTTGNEETVIAHFKQLGIQGKFYSWEDAAGLMKSVTKSFLSINVVLSFVAILIAAVTIFIVIYIDISSKKREIGILRAIGIKPSIIQWTYILQSVFYSVSGVALGSALFFGAILPYFLAHPFRLPIVDASLSFAAADLTIRIESIFAVSILSGLIPALHFMRIKLLDAIWGAK
ncbi:MAG: ABC transporter permease [bacterium]